NVGTASSCPPKCIRDHEKWWARKNCAHPTGCHYSNKVLQEALKPPLILLFLSKSLRASATPPDKVRPSRYGLAVFDFGLRVIGQRNGFNPICAKTLHGLDHVLVDSRLCDKSAASQPVDTKHEVSVSRGGENHNGYSADFRIVSDLLQRLHPVFFRHIEIEKYETR